MSLIIGFSSIRPMFIYLIGLSLIRPMFSYHFGLSLIRLMFSFLIGMFKWVLYLLQSRASVALCLLYWLMESPTLVDLTSIFFVLCTNVNVYLYNYSYWAELSMNIHKGRGYPTKHSIISEFGHDKSNFDF